MTDRSREVGGELHALLDDLVAFVRRFVVLSREQSDAVALWIFHTHAFDAADTTPYLAITSAEKRSGKTRLLEVLELLVARPWLTGRTTPAALVRKVDAEKATLLLDESDAAFKGPQEYAEALRGVLNSGFRRGGKATVCVGQGANITARDFDTFSPKAIAGIGSLPDTVADRSIHLRLSRRNAETEPVERLRYRDAAVEVEPLRITADSLATEITPMLAEARPALPEQLTDRAQDVWEPLLAVADLAGGSWPARARTAAVALAEGADAQDDSLGVKLLTDVRAIFDVRGADRLSSESLVDSLNGMDESPWSEWKRGSGLTQRQLARLLRPYDIFSRTVRFSGSDTARGYLREQFEDAWRRYIPTDAPASPPESDTETQRASLSGETRVTSSDTACVVSLPETGATRLAESDVPMCHSDEQMGEDAPTFDAVRAATFDAMYPRRSA